MAGVNATNGLQVQGKGGPLYFEERFEVVAKGKE